MARISGVDLPNEKRVEIGLLCFVRALTPLFYNKENISLVFACASYISSRLS